MPPGPARALSGGFFRLGVMIGRTLFLAFGLAVAVSPDPAQSQVAARGDEIGGPGATETADGIGRFVFAGVAIDSFHVEAPWKTLANAVNDLTGVRNVLEERYGFESRDEWVLANTVATKDAILELLDELSDPDTGLRPDDALVFFYAGHGTERVDTAGTGEVRRRGFLVPHDVTKPLADAPRQYLEIADLVEALGYLRARHVLLILDSCQSGLALTAGDGLKDERSLDEMSQLVEDLARNPSRLVVTSAKSDQSAFDGGPVEGHSLFTGYLMEGLLRASEGGIEGTLDTERGRLVTSELFDYVQQQVATAAPSTQTPTFGAFLARGDEPRGQLVLNFGVDEFDDAYAEALAHLNTDIDETREFREAMDRALAAEDEETEAPRAWYLRYLEAMIEGDEDLAEEVTALRRLQGFADADMPLPDDWDAPRVARQLRSAEKLCAREACAAGAAP